MFIDIVRGGGSCPALEFGVSENRTQREIDRLFRAKPNMTQKLGLLGFIMKKFSLNLGPDPFENNLTLHEPILYQKLLYSQLL